MVYLHKKTLFVACLALGPLLLLQSNEQPQNPPAVAEQSAQCSVKNRVEARTGEGFCPEELQVLEFRVQAARTVLQELLKREIPLNHTPIIGVVLAGGGCRAAISGTGFLSGLEKINMMDATSYIAALSGSTWTLSSLLYHNHSITAHKDYLRSQLSKTFDINNIEIGPITETLLNRFTLGQIPAFNDLYGALLANLFLKKDKTGGQQVHLSELTETVSQGIHPIPLFTAVIAETEPNYEWMEFSPFEIGSAYLKAWIKPEDSGKTFRAGVSNSTYPEKKLGFLLGCFGSAYAFSVYDFMHVIAQSIDHHLGLTFFGHTIPSIPWGTLLRFYPPLLYNFSYKMPESPLQNMQVLTVVDGGMDLMIPFPPLLRRGVDVYLVCDAGASAPTFPGATLVAAAEFAKKHNYPFPEINVKDLSKDSVSVIHDKKNPQAPILVYIPNTHKFATLKFDYTPDEFNVLFDFMENGLVDAKDSIISAIELAIANLETRNIRSLKDRFI